MKDGAVYGQLGVFHAIVQEKGISAAARRLGVAAPSVSKALKLLEARLGAPLFYRSTRRIELTREGRQLYERTVGLADQLDAALDEVRAAGEQVAGSLRITLARFAWRLVLEPVLAELAQRFPALALEVSINEGMVDVIEQGFDAGIRFGDQVDEGMVARRLLPPMRQGLYASADYLARHGVPRSPAELAGHRLIGYRFVTANRLLPLTLVQEGQSEAVDMPTALVCNDIEVIADAVRQGLGIGRLFEPLHQRLPDAAQLLPVMEPYWQTYPAVYLYHLQSGRHLRRVQALADFLVQAHSVSF